MQQIKVLFSAVQPLFDSTGTPFPCGKSFFPPMSLRAAGEAAERPNNKYLLGSRGLLAKGTLRGRRDASRTLLATTCYFALSKFNARNLSNTHKIRARTVHMVHLSSSDNDFSPSILPMFRFFMWVKVTLSVQLETNITK